ncbi:RDD family protein [Streptomyces sp. NPDC057284]|uniref:RDD family protein n=1 Tax=Streptomyces sp. NPDC057284 TaxID=3346083 RepID=UPI0036300789
MAVFIDPVIAVAVILGPLIALDRILVAASVDDLWLPSAAAWPLAFLLLYSPLSVSRWGGTVGKRLLGMEVVRDADGGQLSYGAPLVRHLSKPRGEHGPGICDRPRDGDRPQPNEAGPARPAGRQQGGQAGPVTGQSSQAITSSNPGRPHMRAHISARRRLRASSHREGRPCHGRARWSGDSR